VKACQASIPPPPPTPTPWSFTLGAASRRKNAYVVYLICVYVYVCVDKRETSCQPSAMARELTRNGRADAAHGEGSLPSPWAVATISIGLLRGAVCIYNVDAK